VAVGRAIVRKPKVFLFDEPLSNLDAKMRVATRAEISRLHKRLGATMIYVTHDQIEAMTMGDRICVMKDGDIMQVAEPLELYNRPANLFVAGFIGSPAMNFFKGQLRQRGGFLEFTEDNAAGQPLALRLPEALAARAAAHVDHSVILGLRPEDISDTAVDGAAPVDAKVELAEPMGAETHLHLTTGVTSFIARANPAGHFTPNQTVRVFPRPEKAHVFQAATGLAIR